MACIAATYFLLAARYLSAWRIWTSQTLLSLAALSGAVAWLKHAGWITTLEQIADKPENLQVCGIALGLLSLAWVLLRIIVGWDTPSAGPP